MLYYSTHSGCHWHSAAVMGHVLNTQLFSQQNGFKQIQNDMNVSRSRMCHSLVIVNSDIIDILQLSLERHYLTDLKQSAFLNKVQMSEP